MMQSITHFLVIINDMIHVGDSPALVDGVQSAGVDHTIHFDLPEKFHLQEPTVIQCRTLHNQIPNKVLLINQRPLPNFLDPHPHARREWVVNMRVIPAGWLRSGNNVIHIRYEDKNFDDFIIDDLILWYKTSHE
jgi:hypothetical protein